MKSFLDALPFAELEVVALAGCFRFLEFEAPLASSSFAEKDDVPGIESLAAEAGLVPFTAV